MNFLSHQLRVCYLAVLVKLLNGYLLFAANIEDFQAIADKLLADNIAKGLIRTNPSRTDYEYEEYSEEYEVSRETEHHRLQDKQKKPFKNDRNNLKDIDFNELVERVRKRIEKELKEKYLNLKNSEKSFDNDDKIVKDEDDTDKGLSDNDNEYKIEKPKRKINKKKPKENRSLEETTAIDYETEYVEVTTRPKNREKMKKSRIQEKRYEYADALLDFTTTNKPIRITKKQIESVEKKETKEDDMPFKKISMNKKDSYEDYKAPEKESNIFSSSETQPKLGDKNKKRFKIQSDRKKNNRKRTKNNKVQKSKSKITKVTPKDYYEEEIIEEEEEVKARTETLGEFNEKSFKKNVKLGTNIPTRERYIAVTPNYNEKIPNLVEKYDFNEPLPDRDRERQDMKYFANPPARINKKVPLT